MTRRTTDEDAAVTVRAEDGIDEETLGYARTKVDAVLSRPGLPAVTGEVRIAKAAAPDVERPWTAGSTPSALRRGTRCVAGPRRRWR
ncbi:hypothetical protein [Streptomyces sp. Inha503]|uniref:hypothetical protein n=1 Tax=Streptomyces sp. Inha503 TaxID=3383314 RepID=UPI00399F53D4